jgi:hypothetical protein
MYHGVKSVKAIEGYRLIIGFDSGEFRVFNVKPLLSLGRFSELTSQQEFMKAKVAFDTVEWENGLDLDPEYLYEGSEAMPCEQSTRGDAEKSRP